MSTEQKKPALVTGDIEEVRAKYKALKEKEAETKKAREDEALRVLVTFTEKLGKREEKWDACVTPDDIFVVATSPTSDVQWQKYQAETKRSPEGAAIALQHLVAHHIVYPSAEAFNRACQSTPALAERIGTLYLLPLLRGHADLKMGES
ncbi:MAG: hypothetical protein KF764_02980 [Labilithrix sp.]|nr:hypothetical protein [Labilithrix sp.]